MSTVNPPSRVTLRRVLFSLGVVAALGCVVYFLIIRPARLQRKAAAAAARAEKKAAKKYQRPAQSVVARVGLPNLRRKLAAQEPVTVAFLGGSITQNGGKGGFVSMIPTWIESRAPGVKVTVVNAGIAATGSDLGAKRVERDVLAHRPDLVVVEFAVNDSDRDCVADMERIVRKIRMADPRTDILFIYTVMDWTLPRLESGKFPPSVKRHELVAEHYGIPTVALGYEAARRIRLGEWTWATFSPDACHPTEQGYESYNRDFETALPMVFEAQAPARDPLPPTLTPGLILDPPATPAPSP